MKNKLLIFGFGYVARFLSASLKNYDITATSRQNKTCNRARIIKFEFDEVKQAINETTHLIITTPPEEKIGCPTFYHFQSLIKEAPHLKYICYLSATSVYGDHKGNWVDENSNLNLENPRGKMRYKAESGWAEFSRTLNIPMIIMRISAIYGPGRNILEQLKNGTAKAIYKENQLFSRIYIDDICNIISLSMEKDKLSNIYNLADDLPSPQYEVIEYGAKLLNIPSPTRINFEEADLSLATKEFYLSSKKISNQKIKDQLHIKLKYPNYMSGLEAIKTNA